MESDRNELEKAPDEIQLRDIILTLWAKRRFIIKVSSLFALAGLLISFLIPVEYTATVTFIPQTTEKTGSLGNLGGLAAMAGINLQGLGTGSEIPPSIYPKVVSSSIFRRNLISSTILENGKPITYSDYFEKREAADVLGTIKKYTIGLPGEIIRWIKGEVELKTEGISGEIVVVTEKENKHFERLSDQIKVTFDKKENSVQLAFAMPTPELSAQMAQVCYELLQKELIKYKIDLAKEQEKFIQSQFDQKKKTFEAAQARLAYFRDQNQNLSSARATNREEELEAEYNLALTIYTEMAKQLEQAKIQVSKDTPIFSVVQPVAVPLLKSTLSKLTMIILTLFAGSLASVIWVLVFRETYSNLKREIIKDY